MLKGRNLLIHRHRHTWRVYCMLSTMWKTRIIEHCRCCILISRLYPPAVRLLEKRGVMRGVHRAFFLDGDEKVRRGYAFMYGNGDWETTRACWLVICQVWLYRVARRRMRGCPRYASRNAYLPYIMHGCDRFDLSPRCNTQST